MHAIGIWSDFEDYKSFGLLKKYAETSVCLSKDWVLAGSPAEGFSIFRHPYTSVPRSFAFTEDILEVSCNLGMALLLTSSGEIWLWGEDTTKSNLFAQEGLFKTETPVKMPKTSTNAIVSASLGNSHAGMVCSEGFLYTWGKGNNGELGYKSITSSPPSRVESANIFKAKQVICGRNYTGICTQGGFLYIFGSGIDCECGGNSGYPYTIPALEEYYVKSAYSSPFGIVVLTDAGKLYIVKGCLCLTYLRANKTIQSVATCSEGVCGLTRDKSFIYAWTQEREKEWRVTMYKLDAGGVSSLVSGLGTCVALLGDNIGRFPGRLMNGNYSPDPSPHTNKNTDRKSFEQLLGFYDFEAKTSQNTVNKEEGSKILVGTLEKIIGNAFRKIKVYAYLQLVYKKAYASTFTPSIIGKVLQRINVLDKSYAFEMIYKSAKMRNIQKESGNVCNSGAKIIMQVLEYAMKHIFHKVHTCNSSSFYIRKQRLIHGIHLLKQIEECRAYRVILRILKYSDKDSYLKVCLILIQKKFLNKILRRIIEPIFVSNNQNTIKINPFIFSKNMIEKNEFYRAKRYFKVWYQVKSSNNRRLQNEKLNAILMVTVKLGKLVRNKYITLFNILVPSRRIHQLKYGLYFLLSCISKIQSKNKSYSFNSILRQKSTPNHIETLAEILRLLIRPTISSSFQRIQLFSINKRNQSLIKFILMLQAIQEKIKYRQIIRGYNSFKRIIFNKSITYDCGSEKSFSIKSLLTVLIPSPNSPPSFEQSEIVCMSSRTYDTPSTERRSSLHSFQQNLVKKFSDKISNESKSSIVHKPKIISTKKGKQKEGVNDKRFAYAEALKERQKRKVSSKTVQEPSISSLYKKPVINSLLRKDEFDPKSWRAMKYRKASSSLEPVLSKILWCRKIFSFNKLKFFLRQARDHAVLMKKIVSLEIPEGHHKKSGCVTQRDMQGSEALKRNGKGLFIDLSKRNRAFSGEDSHLICDSPIESPISVVKEDLFPSPSYSGEPETGGLLEQLTLPPNSWKVKLYSLGFVKISRTIRVIIKKQIFRNYLARIKN